MPYARRNIKRRVGTSWISILYRGKFNMSHRLKTLMEEKINLAKYGEAVQHISFSPLIGEVFPPISEYIPSEKTVEVQFLMNPKQAIEVNEPQFFQLMLDGLVQAMEEINLPDGFDFETFRKDVLGLQYEQLQQAA